MRRRDKQIARRSRTTRMVARIRSVSMWSLLVAILVFAIAFGLRPWVIGVAVFGLVYAGISRALSDRIAERFERQPDLALQAAVGDGRWGDSPPPARPLWPFDSETIVSAETKRLAEGGDVYESASRGPGGLLIRGALSAPAGDAAYERARRAFDTNVEEYATALRQWLDDYRDRAEERARTFELDLLVTAGSGGAYAEDVELVLTLPEGITVVDGMPTISTPPDPPVYEPPPSVPLFGTAGFTSTAPLLAPIRVPSFGFGRTVLPKRSTWTIEKAPSRASASLGDIHHGNSVHVSEALFVRVASTGRFEIPWTLLTKSSRPHPSGTLVLVVPEPEERPPFKRLHGIEAYPDVAIVNDDGEVVHEPRTTDPPTSPPSAELHPATGTSSDLVDRLRERHAFLEWRRLGLGEEDGHAEAE